MIAVLLAAVVGADSGAPSPGTLAGLTLGTTFANASSEHPDAQLRRNGAGSRWTWKRPAGGTVTVLLDNFGTVAQIYFVADRGEGGVIDLPCVGNFPVQDSHVNLGVAINRKECVPAGDGTYRLHDGSILNVLFADPGDGQLDMVHWYKPGAMNAASQTARVAITVFECEHDATAAPKLTIYDLDRIFAAGSIVPTWSFEDPVWKTTISLPAGHYILSARTTHCSGETEQLVAVSDRTRHVTMTLDERQANPKAITVRIDEDMYASAVYGLLPGDVARIEMMSADSLIGEQSRQTAKIDNDIYEFDHLRSGSYILRASYGDIWVSREVVIPANQYGVTVRADLTPEDASEIVREQAAGSAFVPVHYNGPPLQTFRIGNASVDGWTTELLKPSDYRPSAQRISATALGALAAVQGFLKTDRRIPERFSSLSSWSARNSGTR